jgi:maltose-binding protein MalE
MLSGSYSIAGLEELSIPFGVASYPFDSETGRWISPMVDIKGFGITRKTREPILSLALLEYLTGCNVQQRFCVPVKKIPANRDVLSFYLESGDALSKLFQHALQTGTFVPAQNTYDLYKNTMWKLIRFVFLDQMSIPDVLEKGQEIINANMWLE